MNLSSCSAAYQESQTEKIKQERVGVFRLWCRFPQTPNDWTLVPVPDVVAGTATPGEAAVVEFMDTRVSPASNLLLINS